MSIKKNELQELSARITCDYGLFLQQEKNMLFQTG